MTVDLYFFQPLVTNSARVYLSLLEKGVPFNEHVLGPQMSHLSDEFKKINPRGQVPAMVHDGNALYEGMTMNEYIDEVFDGPPLRPKNLVEREHMRSWCRYAENDLGRALMMINWNRIMPARSGAMSQEDLERFAKSVPDPDRRRSWTNARTGGTPVAEIEESYRRVVCRRSTHRKASAEEQVGRRIGIFARRYRSGELHRLHLLLGAAMDPGAARR